jgi:hypothetical protein
MADDHSIFSEDLAVICEVYASYGGPRSRFVEENFLRATGHR